MSFAFLAPFTITPAMLSAGTSIPEVDASRGEVLWNAATNYAIGALVVRTTTNRVYRNVIAGVNASLPEDTPDRWQDLYPTNRFAPFDIYISTPARATTSLTYVLNPQFFNGLSVYGLQGNALSLVLRDAPGGALLTSVTQDLVEQALGLYELLFTPLRPVTSAVFRDLPISPTAELTLTVSAGTGNPVSLGMLNIGNFVQLNTIEDFGGTQYEAAAEPKSNSYIKFFEDGTLDRIIRRGAKTDLTGEVLIRASDAAAAVQNTQAVLDVPVSVIATRISGYQYLNGFGLLSARVVANDFTRATYSYTFKGFL